MFFIREYSPGDTSATDPEPWPFRGDGTLENDGNEREATAESGPSIARLAISIAILVAIPVVAAIGKFLIWGSVAANH